MLFSPHKGDLSAAIMLTLVALSLRPLLGALGTQCPTVRYAEC